MRDSPGKKSRLLKAGVTVYELWNMVLRPDREEHRCKKTLAAELHDYGRSCNARVRYTPLFGAVGSFSEIRPAGSRMIETEGVSAEADAVAFIDPAGRIITVLYNRKEALFLSGCRCAAAFTIVICRRRASQRWWCPGNDRRKFMSCPWFVL